MLFTSQGYTQARIEWLPTTQPTAPAEGVTLPLLKQDLGFVKVLVSCVMCGMLTGFLAMACCIARTVKAAHSVLASSESKSSGITTCWPQAILLQAVASVPDLKISNGCNAFWGSHSQQGIAGHQDMVL